MSYNRIMAYNVKYNWLTFYNNPMMKKDWWILVLKEFSFFEVATSSNTEKYAIKHWEYVSPTEMKNRRVRLLFDILANTEKERRDLLKQVQRAFTPESNPSPFNSRLWKKLSFLDVNCEEWTCNCQVYKGLQLSDFANEKRVWISVELITDSPYFKWWLEQTTTTTNSMRGIKLPTELWFNFQYYKKQIEYSWVIATPVKIIMTITNNNQDCFPLDKIKIVHESDYWTEALHLENINSLLLNIGSTITIDSEERRCYLGTEDITWLISIWSQRPTLTSWNNVIAIDTWVFDECINATISWNNMF